jgi:hypothetical protein
MGPNRTLGITDSSQRPEGLYWYQVVPAFVISPTGQWSVTYPPDDHGERLCFGSTIALRGFALNLSAMRGDEVQKTPFVIVGTDVGVSVPSLCHGSLHAGQHRRVFRVNGRMPRMTWTAVRVQQTVDRTPGGVFNRPF